MYSLTSILKTILVWVVVLIGALLMRTYPDAMACLIIAGMLLTLAVMATILMLDKFYKAEIEKEINRDLAQARKKRGIK